MAIKTLSEKTIEYMNRVWGFNSSTELDDMSMFWDSGEYEMTALRLVEAGAVEANCTEAKEMIRVSKSLTRRYQLEVIDECLKHYHVFQCGACRHTYFYPNQMRDPKDWKPLTCHSCGHVETLKELVERKAG